jgi:AhpD family alkylhydroperoxidase
MFPPGWRRMATTSAVLNSQLNDRSPVRAVPREGSSRLTPIERPRGFVLRMAYWGSRRQFGKVMTPIKVVCARMPGSLNALGGMLKFNTKGIRLDPGLQLLIGHLASQINGCAACLDLGRAMAVRTHVDLGKVDAVREYRTNPKFTDRERAALAYVEEATRARAVSDTTFVALRRHFDEREIVEITWVNAFQNFFNLLNRPLGIGSDGFCSIEQAKHASTRL